MSLFNTSFNDSQNAAPQNFNCFAFDDENIPKFGSDSVHEMSYNKNINSDKLIKRVLNHCIS